MDEGSSLRGRPALSGHYIVSAMKKLPLPPPALPLYLVDETIYWNRGRMLHSVVSAADENVFFIGSQSDEARWAEPLKRGNPT